MPLLSEDLQLIKKGFLLPLFPKIGFKFITNLQLRGKPPTTGRCHCKEIGRRLNEKWSKKDLFYKQEKQLTTILFALSEDEVICCERN